MRAAYFRELRPYSGDEIRAELGASADASHAVIDALMECGIVKYRTGDERDEEEATEVENAGNEQRYLFRYVGIVVALGHAIVCYPKYIRGVDRPVREMRQTLEVIRKLYNEKQLLDLCDGGTRDNRLALILRLLWLYDEYGVYFNMEETRVLNGPGVIDWTRTIDMQLPVISNGVPIYLDCWTRKMRRDEYDLVARLHRAILSEASRFLIDSGLSELLSISTVELTDESPSDLGDAETLRRLIERERVGQFVTWKQDVLNLLLFYLDEDGVDASRESVLRLGTTSYYHAWEVACKAAFGDMLSTRLQELPLELDDTWYDQRCDKLLQIIPRPTWVRPAGMGEAGTVDTLIPDIVTITNDGSRQLFCIYDAKYYVPSGKGKMQRQPGVESVTKQFLYQTAYRDFVDAHGFDAVVNAFLVPTEDDEPRLLASVAFPEIMAAITSELPQFSDHIDMWALPAYEVFDCYLRDRALSKDTRGKVLGGSDGQLLGQDVSADSMITDIQEPLPIG